MSVLWRKPVRRVGPQLVKPFTAAPTVPAVRATVDIQKPRIRPLLSRLFGPALVTLQGAATGLRHRVSDIESAHIASTSRASRLQSDIESAGKLTTTRANPKVTDPESSGKSSTTVEGS
jgi:hypothetical protein